MKNKGIDEYGYGEKNWEESDKLDYLFSEYPMSEKVVSSLGDKSYILAPLRMLNEELIEKYSCLEESYCSDKEYYYLLNNNTQTDDEKKFLEYFHDLNDLENSITKYSEELCETLKRIYLELGSKSVYIHSGMGEDQHLREIEEVLHYLKLEGENISGYCEGIPSKLSLIKIYSMIDENNLEQIVRNVGKEFEVDFKVAKSYVMNTLKKLRPLAKEFSINESSQLLVSFDSDWPDIYPDKLNIKINERVKVLIDDLKNNQELLR